VWLFLENGGVNGTRTQIVLKYPNIYPYYWPHRIPQKLKYETFDGVLCDFRIIKILFFMAL